MSQDHHMESALAGAVWRASSYSGGQGNCVEVADNIPTLAGAAWRISTYSGGQGECVEVADNIPSVIPVRDSKLPTGPVITFTPHAWRTFIAHLG
ncbi:DUF397 domain-containing protein [Streptomyces sp. NBC_00286]|uniref:DUF397 domain-containing protein n=1 Tax=Streptomyces sp. NBC_00286 TaxID=2975701 RepID=UPI002E2A12F9|nr:DUF397 domain-containing protein [Streptomyces sp. NBC_00286]